MQTLSEETGRRRLPLGSSALLFGNFFLIIAALYQLKPASRSLFIELIGSQNLPYVWIATAITLITIISIYNRLLARFSRLKMVVASIVLIIILLALFHHLLAQPTQVSAFCFYIFVDLLSVILVEQFWSLTNAIHNEQEGRRRYALIGTGGLLGGVLGGIAAHNLITYAGMNTLDLLMVASLTLMVLMALTLLMQRFGLYHEHPGDSAPAVKHSSWRAITGNRYLALIALLLLLSQFIQPLVEYQFMHAVEAAFSGRDERTAYLGLFFSLLSAVAIAVNLLLTPLIHRFMGAIAGLIVQPLAVAIATLCFVSMPVLFTAAALKIADRGLSYSINRASKELLYIPVDALLMFQAKAWIDMFGYRVFKVLGSVMILLLTQWLWFSLPVTALSWLTLIICALWAWVLITLNTEYRKISSLHR
ncbi:MAG: Npt1/Npt2 family nucleotide transporter [Mariprofundus sp.]